MDFEYFEAEIDKFHVWQMQNRIMDDDLNDSRVLREKVDTIERDFKKAVEICQAMLVYSKDKHFQSMIMDEQLNQLKLNQDREAQVRQSNTPEYKQERQMREDAQQDQLDKLEYEVKEYAELTERKDEEILKLKQENIRLQDDIDQMNGSFYQSSKKKKDLDVKETQEYIELMEKLKFAQIDLEVLQKTNDAINEELMNMKQSRDFLLTQNQ